MMSNIFQAYKYRLIRKRLLFAALMARRQLAVVCDKTDLIAKDMILGFSAVRNEVLRLPYFLDYHRKLGVGHFLFVDNASDDGTAQYLQKQPDVSLWQTAHSYKDARFGLNWLAWLRIKYGHGHWCLSLDADEILIYPDSQQRRLADLTAWLDGQNIASFGAMMLDMYPKGPLDLPQYAGGDPFEHLCWFDGDNYRHTQADLNITLIQGGVRERLFFQDASVPSPSLNKIPLVKWHRRAAYISSTHSMLPRHLNRVFEPNSPTGTLLHSKFLHIVAQKSREELLRQEHYANSPLYDSYHTSLSKAPDLWCEKSLKYSGQQQLLDLSLMQRGDWV